jgi:hypothetical protein
MHLNGKYFFIAFLVAMATKPYNSRLNGELKIIDSFFNHLL